MSEDGKAATGPLKGRATGAVKGRYSDLPLRIVSALVLAGSA